MLQEASLKEKLLGIVLRKKRYHSHKSILLPQSLHPMEKTAIFAREGFNVLELGAGSGEFALEWLERNPTVNYLALEIKGERISKILRGIDKKNLEQLKILPINFKWILLEILPEHFFDMVVINFPDPWPKRRHWKHRLVDVDFPEKLKYLMRPGAVVHLATDYGPYARRILSIFRKNPSFEAVFPGPGYLRERPQNFPTTKFEILHLKDKKRSYYQQWRLINAG